MRGQQFSEDESRAAAMDRISQFNTRHRQQLQDANLNRINQAQQYNLGMNERNVNRQMTARYHNTGAYGQKFNMDRSKIVGQTGARSDLAGVHRNKMDRMNKATSGLLKGMESDINKAVGGMTGNPGAAMGGQGGGTGAYGGGVQTYSTRNQPQLMAADGTVVKSYNTGGMIPGNEFAGDRVDAQVNSGEMILNVEQQQNLLDLLAGKTNQIDSSVPIVQDNPQMAGSEQSQQQPMQEEAMMDPLAEARQQQQMQQQQAPKLIPDFQSASPAAPIMPPEEPIDALAGMPQEQPISAADGAIAPQPWQQVVYPPVEGAAPMTPMDPTAPVAPVPTAPQGPVQTDAPLETVNVPDTQMAPVTEFGSQPQAPVEQPYVDPAQQQQQQPQQGGTNFLEMLGAPKGSGIGGAVASGFGSGLGALAMAADPDTAMGLDRETRARDEREKVRKDRKQQMEQDKLEKAYSAQQSRLQKQADAAKKREQEQQQPMQEESMMGPLAEARQQQQMQQQQAPKLIPDFQSASPAAPIMPPEEPIDALAGMPQEQPISAADGAIAPQPWQQVVYPPTPQGVPMTPMDPTAPVAPVPTAPQGPVQTDAPLETVNVPDTQMAPGTEFGQSPQTPVEQPYVDPVQQQQQPQQGGTDYLSLLTGSPKGSGIPGAIGGIVGGGLSALAMACLLYTSPSPRDRQKSRMPSSA